MPFFQHSGSTEAKNEGREVISIENTVRRKISRGILDEWSKAWESFVPVKAEYQRSEVNPQFANIVSPSEVVVVNTFHVEIEGGGGDFHITMPYAMLEPIREMLGAGVQSDRDDMDDRWLHSLREEVKSSDVDLSCNLAEAKLSLRDIVDMKPGDIIPFDIPDLVTLCAEKVPVFRGKYGVSRGSMAVKIKEQILFPGQDSQLTGKEVTHE